jgi:HAD superfamily hydrolase (TIGR01549 family)
VNAGLNMSEDACERLIFKIYEMHGVEYQLTFTELLKPFRLPKPEMVRIRNAGITAYLRKKEHVLKPYPGIVGVLDKLREKGYKLGVLTDAPGMQAEQRLRFTGLQDYFEFVGTFHDTNVYKPGAEPFKNILKKMGVEDAREALMVGDNVYRDILGAKRLGMRTCLAKYDPFFENKGAEPDFVADTPVDIIKVVEMTEDGE